MGRQTLAKYCDSFDLDTGRIISSDSDWDNHGLDKEDIYDIAFQSLAEMMEDWLERS